MRDRMNNPREFFRIFSTLIFFALISCDQGSERQLPIYNPSDFNPDLVDKSLRNKSKYHTVSDFSLTNQNGEIISQKDYENKIYVVDFIFTRCETICPIMTANMEEIQNKFKYNKELLLLSLSVTPELDSVSVLRKYANDNGVIDSKWNITTGDKKHIYGLARKSYFAVVTRGDGDLQDFIHTPNFILVDKKKQIRGIYDGTDNNEIVQLIKDIENLIN
ncbi:SCO family protein [Yeosuana sp. MJ-SS3]|uniref:SCO family protein n=1 Tax=Gilvirhabdus luticola TaxID=3079858 RepID=A0ABU3U686_9FLAO|nr:SCO family protein [Yeosuana sp. MJ-SS3]MDU8885824.1 SCO family protein [Yeosuana sp. MJ-SS3]